MVDVLNNSGGMKGREKEREELVDKLGSCGKYIASFNPLVYLAVEFFAHSTPLALEMSPLMVF